jgi:SAM-dependent methyltransferase
MFDATAKNLMALQNGFSICPVLQSYYDQPREIKEALLEKDMAAQYLLGNIPGEVAEMLREGFLSGKHGSEISGWIDTVVKYFQKNSLIIPALTKNPGTFFMLEMMYHFLEVQPPIDLYFLLSIAGGQALKDRFDVVTAWIVFTVSQILGRQEDCLAVDIGSGPGRNFLEAFRRHPGFEGRHKVECIENDEAAIHKGQELVQELGVSDLEFINVSMVGKEIMLKNKGRYDLGINVGVVCGLPRKERVRLIGAHRTWFKKGGRLLVAGLTEQMAKQDLFCGYVLRETTGWGLQYRPLGELAEDAKLAGWKVADIYYEGPGKLYDIVELIAT